MAEKTRKKTRQITLHFTQDTEFILDRAKASAKASIRTAEQELLYVLSILYRTPAEMCASYILPGHNARGVEEPAGGAAGTDGTSTPPTASDAVEASSRCSGYELNGCTPGEEA